MKWRLKKHLSSSSSSFSSMSHCSQPSSFSSMSHCSQPSSVISQMFPFPWLSKFNSKNTAKPKPKPRKSSHSVLPTNPLKCPSLVCENGHGKSYSLEGDGDKFWRLSFGQDSAGDKSERVGPKRPVWYDDELKSVEQMMSLDLQSLKEKNKAKSEAHRKSLYKKKSRVRASSPRAEPCKVKALEDMKRSKVKKKSEKERVQLDGFAIVKSSYNPQKDFKDSMVEMISERKMRSPEELEELLACYLTLNSDDCHGLIIKVFREVWLELGEFENQNVFS